MIISTLMSNGLGIFREMLLANYYGANRHYDLFVLAQYLPAMINAAFFYGLPSVFVPFYFQIRGAKGEHAAERFQGEFLLFWIVVGALICTVSIILTPMMVHQYYQQLSEEDAALLIWANEILIGGTFFSIIFMVIRAILSAHKHFLYPAVAMLALNITVVGLLLVMGDHANLDVLSYSLALGMIFQLLVLLIFLRWMKIPVPVTSGFRSRDIHRSALAALPILGIEMLWGVFYFLDGYFASHLESGNISVVNYALVLFRLPNFLFGITIGAAILPSMSESFNENNMEEVRDKFLSSLRILFLVCVTVTLIFTIAGTELVSFLFQRGAFGESEVSSTAEFLLYVGPSCFFLAGYPIVLRLMSAVRKNVVMIAIFIGGLVIKYTLFSTVFSNSGLRGLAFSIDISLAITFILSLVYSSTVILFNRKELFLFFVKNAVVIVCAISINPFVHPLMTMAGALSVIAFINPSERRRVTAEVIRKIMQVKA